MERELQRAVTQIELWLDENNLEAEISKCVVMCFTNQKLTREPNIYMKGTKIKFTTEHKSLGLILDGPYLTWNKHIEHLRIIGNKRLDVMKRLSSLKWGTGRDTLMMYYLRAIKPKIEYGSAVYGSAANTILGKLDIIHNTALRIASGAFKTSPINSLSLETGVMNLRWSLKINECTQLVAFSRKSKDHPLKEIYPENLAEEQQWRTRRKPLLLRATQAFHQFALIPPRLHHCPTVSPIPPWTNLAPHVHPTIVGITNKTIQLPQLLSDFKFLSNTTYLNFFTLYTDGSHSPDPPATSAAVYVPSSGLCTTWRLPAHADVLTAELFAIDQACNIAITSKQQQIVIYTDS